jgi:hypothetical protein
MRTWLAVYPGVSLTGEQHFNNERRPTLQVIEDTGQTVLAPESAALDATIRLLEQRPCSGLGVRDGIRNYLITAA